LAGRNFGGFLLKPPNRIAFKEVENDKKKTRILTKKKQQKKTTTPAQYCF